MTQKDAPDNLVVTNTSAAAAPAADAGIPTVEIGDTVLYKPTNPFPPMDAPWPAIVSALTENPGVLSLTILPPLKENYTHGQSTYDPSGQTPGSWRPKPSKG